MSNSTAEPSSHGKECDRDTDQDQHGGAGESALLICLFLFNVVSPQALATLGLSTGPLCIHQGRAGGGGYVFISMAKHKSSKRHNKKWSSTKII